MIWALMLTAATVGAWWSLTNPIPALWRRARGVPSRPDHDKETGQ